MIVAIAVDVIVCSRDANTITSMQAPVTSFREDDAFAGGPPGI